MKSELIFLMGAVLILVVTLVLGRRKKYCVKCGCRIGRKGSHYCKSCFINLAREQEGQSG
jgi:hypothetical protein